jgi:hypothetical protein
MRGDQSQPSGGNPDGEAGEENDRMTDGDPDDGSAHRERTEQGGDEGARCAVHVGLQVSGGNGESEIDGAAAQHAPGGFVAELVGDEPDEVGAVLVTEPLGVEADELPVDPQGG